MTGTSATEEADGKLLATGWVTWYSIPDRDKHSFCSPPTAVGPTHYAVQRPTDIYWFFDFLCALAKLRKAALSYVMSVRLSLRPHGTLRLPLYTFS